MHKGTVMYICRNMLPCLKFGSRLLDTVCGTVFTIVRSPKMTPYHQSVKLHLLYITVPKPCSSIEQTVEWPNLWWKLLSLSSTESKPPLSYLDQLIPSPLNLWVPQSWSPEDILFWLTPTLEPTEPLRSLSVDDYFGLLKRAQMMQKFFSFCYRCMCDKRG